MSNFLENLVIPQLGSPTFQNDFEAFCSVIKNNFERLVSVQFTKGNDGNSVVTQRILIGDGLTATNTMPNMVYQIVKSIYKFESDEPMTIGQFKQALEGTHNKFGEPDNGGLAPSFYDAYSFPELQDLSGGTTTGFYVDVVLDEHNGMAYIAVPYIFIDGRISELSRYKREHTDTDVYKDFHDYSTAVFGKGEFVSGAPDIQDWNWETDSMDIVPKLYFDDNIGEFCWEVNGQHTGVTAQGVKGNDGIASNVYMARGNRTGNNISIESIQFVDDEGNIKWLPITEKLEDVENYINGVKTVIKSVKCSEGQDSIILRDTDFLLVFYNGENPNQNPDENPPQNSQFEYRWAFFGKPHMNSNNSEVHVYCQQDKSDDIFLAILNQDFRNDLNGIYNSSDPSVLRGLFIPGRKSSQADEDPSYYHMTWSEDNGNDISKLHSAPVTPGNTHTPIDDPCNGYIGDWQVDYNMQVQGALGVQGNVTMKNDACVQGNLNVQGNIEASSINVTGNSFNSVSDVRPAVICTFKNTSYKIYRSIMLPKNPPTAVGIANSNNIGYDVEINTSLNIKVGMLSHSYMGGNINTNINKQMHKMVGRYGKLSTSLAESDPSEYGYMWFVGNVDDLITGDAQIINADEFFYNAPKLYDVIEYDIPIHIYKFVRGVFNLNKNTSPQTNTPEYYTKDGITMSSSTGEINLNYDNTNTWVIGVHNDLSYTKFNDISYRVLYKGEYVENSGTTCPASINYISNMDYESNPLIMQDSDIYAQCSNTSPYLFIKGAMGELYDRYFNSITYPDRQGYSFNGSLDYKGQIIEYHIDFLIRLQEIIERQMWDKDQSTQGFELTNNSNVNLLVTPIGYIQGFGEYKSPIFGSIPIDNALIDTQKTITNFSPILNSLINENVEFKTMLYCTNINSHGTYKYDYQVFNSSQTNSPSYLGIMEKEGSPINYGANEVADERQDAIWHNPTLSPTTNLEGKYTNLTQNIRVVDENLKVCPNNMDDGTWKHDDQGYYWVSNKVLYPMIFSQDCYINGGNAANWNVGLFDAKHPIVVDGLLTYPYGPALLTHFDEDTHDKYGQYYQDKYSPMPIGGTGKPFYHKQGKILGNTNSTTKGMVFVEDTTEP